jgi:hypothetical protein
MIFGIDNLRLSHIRPLKRSLGAVPSLSTNDGSNMAVFGMVASLERIYQRVEQAALFLSRVSLWPVALLFLPKINLISFGGETAGIRLDDIVLFVVVIILFGSWIADLRFKIDNIPAVTFVVIAIFCLSNAVNLEHSNVLYSLRLVEYAVFFWAGKSLVRSRFDFTSVAMLLIGINCAAILAQLTGVVGGFTADGYTSAIGRPFGISANHPAEMGALLNLSFAALVFDERMRASRRFWLWCLVVAVCIFITESRSALVIHCVLTWIYQFQHARSRTAFMLKSAFVTGALVSVLVFVPNPVRDRSSDLFSTQNMEAARQLYDSMPAEKQFTGFTEGGEAEDAPEDVDISWYMRGFKWTYVIKIMFTAPWQVWVLGLGPGALGPALDGGWLRLLAETGVVGTFAFLTLLWKISRLSRACAMAVLALAANMVMVDSQNAYKVMAFLFLLAGVYAQRKMLESCAPSPRSVPYPSREV